MKIRIDGIGKISNSTVELNGLTVISGENDTGKSTFGKVFYSVIQACNSFQFVVASQNKIQLQDAFENLYFNIRRELDISERADIRQFFSALRGGVLSRDDIPQSIVISIAKELIEKHKLDLSDEAKRKIENQLNNIERLASSPDKEDSAIRKSVDRLLKSEFFGDIVCNCPERNGKDAVVEIFDGATTVLSFNVDSNKVKDFKSSGPLGINDSTLIEGPSIINYYPALSNFDMLGVQRLRGGEIPYHVVDLAKKLQGVKRNFDLLSQGTLRNFPEVLNGDLQYDEKKLGFIFNDGNSSIPSINVASGIKAFAIMELLILGDYVNENSLIVLDEPETNLHPRWQIIYARQICELVRRGAKILVTTHSPYMLEALRGFSTKEDFAKFYLSKKLENKQAKLVDVNGDITEIIDVLSQPLVDLINELGE